MRALAKYLLIGNLIFLLFVVLWLLVGGSRGGYFGGGAASEVDGILLMVLAAFNVIFLLAVFFSLPTSAPGPIEAYADAVIGEATLGDGQIVHQETAEAARKKALAAQASQNRESLRKFLHGWSKLALGINGALILFIGLWLLISSDRRGYFQANATEVDMIVLFVVSLFNVAFMILSLLRFSPRRL